MSPVPTVNIELKVVPTQIVMRIDGRLASLTLSDVLDMVNRDGNPVRVLWLDSGTNENLPDTKFVGVTTKLLADQAREVERGSSPQ